MFLEHQISLLECDTEDWSNGCWKFSFAITGINYILRYIKFTIYYIENSFQTIIVLMYFFNTKKYCL